VNRGSIAAALLIAALSTAQAQNLITQGNWEGFALRDTDNKFDRCVLYNRTVEALTASPYQMLGITRDAAGHIGLLVFYDPRTFTRGDTAVRVTLDQRAPVSVAGNALSDFHVNVPTLDAPTAAALRSAKSIEVSTADRTIRFDLGNIAAVLDELETCVKIYGPKS
jgi:hypothetical protein